LAIFIVNKTHRRKNAIVYRFHSDTTRYYLPVQCKVGRSKF